jgi:CDP-diacylglycerol--glycerol-3-phosphate 3-phosphatidyltransferase
MPVSFLFDQLVQRRGLPLFRLQASQLAVLYQPIEFYNELLQGVKTARRRIAFSGLYMGSGNFERLLLQHVGRSLAGQPELQARFLFDRNRSMRKERGASCLDMLIQLRQDASFGSRVQVGLKSPARREILGVHHEKVYICDDRVILTGANLSTHYFTNRQDRYLLVEDRLLADYLHEWVGLSIGASLKLNFNGDMEKEPKKKGKAELLWSFMHEPTPEAKLQLGQ